MCDQLVSPPLLFLLGAPRPARLSAISFRRQKTMEEGGVESREGNSPLPDRLKLLGIVNGDVHAEVHARLHQVHIEAGNLGVGDLGLHGC